MGRQLRPIVKRPPDKPQTDVAVSAAGLVAARVLLGWPVENLALEAAVDAKTVRRLEQGGRSKVTTRRALVKTLHRHGVGITEDGNDAFFRNFRSV